MPIENDQQFGLRIDSDTERKLEEIAAWLKISKAGVVRFLIVEKYAQMFQQPAPIQSTAS